MREIDIDSIFDLLRTAILNLNPNQISELESHLNSFSQMFKQLEEKGDFPEDLYDSEWTLSEIINDSEFRSDNVGENACKDPVILDLVYDHLAAFNENIEVVLATNPYISEELLQKLAKSEFEWEEDGTRQALARNRSEAFVLELLARIENPNVQYAVARNANTPKSVLESLVESTGQCNWQIEEILFGEVSAYKGFVRYAVITNHNCPRSAIERVTSGSVTSLGSEVDKEMKRVAGLQIL